MQEAFEHWFEGLRDRAKEQGVEIEPLEDWERLWAQRDSHWVVKAMN